MFTDIATTDNRYKVIYADPPWSYRDKRLKHGGATKHYKTMKLSEIKAMDVARIADDNCLLFIWVTFPNLQAGLDVIEAWGFKYKTLGFSWHKTNKHNDDPAFGAGWYTRANCEVCLIGVKGKPFKASSSVSSAIISPREEHSRKPDEARDRIVRFAGDVPRIELFARRAAPGWDCWGHGVE